MDLKEKQLLLADLCARLPYGVICKIALYKTAFNVLGIVEDKVKLDSPVYDEGDDWWEVTEVKPYLRPMSSMTEEEREEVEVLIFGEWFAQDSGKVDGEGWIEILANYDVSGIDPGFCSDYVDWLLSHHFDIRGLIEKNLALEAPVGMYN